MTACSRAAARCQGPQRQASGLVKGEAETDGQHAGVGGHHQSDQDFGLAEHGFRKRTGTILRAPLATVQPAPLACHSS